MARSDRLARRNTLIFMWKNTAGARLLAALAWLPVRLGATLAARAIQLRGGRDRGPGPARPVLAARRALAVGDGGWIERQEAFFRRFRW